MGGKWPEIAQLVMDKVFVKSVLTPFYPAYLTYLCGP